MKRKEIEEIVAQYPLRDVREIVLAAAVRVHDAALEEAAEEAFSWGNRDVAKYIRALKIGAKR